MDRPVISPPPRGRAYLLCAPGGQGADRAAARLAASFVCTGEVPPCGACTGCRKAAEGIHPDVTVAGDWKKPLGVDEVRAIRADAYVLPNEAAEKVYVLLGADRMGPGAQNALLKLLEDGPDYAVFLLLAENELALLPTVRSRCALLRLPPGGERAEDAELAEEAQRMAGLLLGGDELALMEYAVQLEGFGRDRLALLLEGTMDRLRGGLVGCPAGAEAKLRLGLMDQLTQLRRACDFNIGEGHLAGWLAAGRQTQQDTRQTTGGNYG